MRKPESLKALLLATVPGLADNPERLAMFVDRGRIVGANGRSLSYEYRYTLNVVVEGFAGDPDTLMVPVLAWIAEHQPALVAIPNGEPFSFEAEILDTETTDVSISIELSEPVLVAARDGGGYVVSHPAPPAPRAADTFSGIEGAVQLWQVFLNDVLVAGRAE